MWEGEGHHLPGRRSGKGHEHRPPARPPESNRAEVDLGREMVRYEEFSVPPRFRGDCSFDEWLVRARPGLTFSPPNSQGPEGTGS